MSDSFPGRCDGADGLGHRIQHQKAHGDIGLMSACGPPLFTFAPVVTRDQLQTSVVRVRDLLLEHPVACPPIKML